MNEPTQGVKVKKFRDMDGEERARFANEIIGMVRDRLAEVDAKFVGVLLGTKECGRVVEFGVMSNVRDEDAARFLLLVSDMIRRDIDRKAERRRRMFGL